MKIAYMDLYEFTMPLVSVLTTSFGGDNDHHSILIKMTSTDGVVGWGEWSGDGPGYSYETIKTAWHIIKEYLAPMLFKAEVNHPSDAVEIFKWVRGHNFTKASLESPLWDMAAQMAGQSLSQFIDAGRGIVKSRVSVGVSVGIQSSPEKLIEVIHGYLADGYGRIKIKIKPGRDIGDARAARKATPNGLLQVDANSAYTLKTADVFKEMEELGLLLIEQPLGYEDIYEHSKLQPQLKTPVCLDESIHTPDHARMAIELGACKIINIKQGRVGGLTHAIAIHDICQEHGIPVWCGGMLETGIGRALNVALASLPNFKLPSDLSASRRYYVDDTIDPAFEINDDSTLTVPTGVGLGVNVRMDRVQKVTLRHEVLSAASI
jgi:O-succinylbenzoate synthase